MIHIDTNALIALPLWAREGHSVIERIAAGVPAGVSAVVWYEFLIGPVAEERSGSRVLSYGETSSPWRRKTQASPLPCTTEPDGGGA
jgi:hypothetical protein